jgi:HrpA-like RNA helicase
MSHVIIDEAHERDITTDVLLVFLRRALEANPDLKLIIMSATINVNFFSEYFDKAPIVQVPGLSVTHAFFSDLPRCQQILFSFHGL